MTCTCPAAGLCNIARSNTITVSRCRACGAYRLTTTDGTHSAGGDTLALCEIIESLIKSTKKEAPMIISCINHKGGVAKTTTAYHIAAGAAARGVRPLLIDMDPQGNLTRMCGALRQGPPTIGDVLGGAHSATSAIRQAKQYISFDSMTGGHIVASNIGLENVAVGLMQRMFDKLTALKDALNNEGRDQLVIIDTPPNAGVLTLNALVASTHTIVCADPEEDAISGIKTMIDIIARIPRERLDPPALLGVLATRVDAVSSRHADNLARLLSPNMPTLLGEIPKRNGRDADRQLALAYAPVVDQILAEAGLLPAMGVNHA